MTSRTTGLIADITATEVSTLEDELNKAVDKARAKTEQDGTATAASPSKSARKSPPD